MMTAYDLSRPTTGGVSFGIDPVRTAAALRQLADKIDEREIILQSGGVYMQARNDDFVMTVLNLKFHEKREEKF